MYGQEECTPVHQASRIDALAMRSVSPAMHSFGAPLSLFRVIEIIKFIENNENLFVLCKKSII
jgi:hypothetical protein